MNLEDKRDYKIAPKICFMNKIISSIKNSFFEGIYDNQILKSVTWIKIALYLSTLMNFISLLFIVFSHSQYYYKFATPNLLDALLMLTIYSSFYILLFVTLPASIILLLFYFLYKWKRKIILTINFHLKLLILNVVLLSLFIIFVAMSSVK